MIKSLLATFLLITTLLFTGCTTPIAGLQGYTSGSQGYQFLYPKGWTQVDVKKVERYYQPRPRQ
jgi:photosystem II oxygen-evolving enhancer protein 2